MIEIPEINQEMENSVQLQLENLQIIEIEEIRMAKFEVYEHSAAEYRWRFRANNNKIIAISLESYVNKHDCLHSIRLIQEGTSDAEINDQTE